MARSRDEAHRLAVDIAKLPGTFAQIKNAPPQQELGRSSPKMKKEIIASIRIRFDALFLSGARPFLRRGPGEQVFFFFEFFQRTMRMLAALEPGTPTACPAQRCRPAPGWKAPSREPPRVGPFQFGVPMTERRFPPPWSVEEQAARFSE